MNRKEFLKTAAWGAASLFVPRLACGDEPPIPKTFTYKTAGGCEIQLDAYGSDSLVPKPALVWIHGGALIMGSKKRPPRWLNPQGDQVVISIDYRLAPETKLAEIIEDVRAAFRWIHHQGPKLLNITTDKLMVAGGSAGGYLTLMTGFSIQPRPQALLSLSGYGDITAPWYSQPSPFYLQQPRISNQEALASVGTACLAESRDDAKRGKFYYYCRQNGIWPKEVAGHDPATEPRWFDPYCPVRNISPDYPPTVLIHGTADTDVPYEESAKMDEALARAKVEHKFITVPGGSHGLHGLDPAQSARIFKEAVDYWCASAKAQ
jgi:acetyl esterase/lipase